MSANFSPEMEGYSDVRPFRFWCQKVLPLVYDDSLSYYELLCKVTDYINKIIGDLSATETNVDALKTAYDELEQYVNDYFESLDIQQEIDNRLDEMVEDGTLSAMIAPLVSPIIVDWLEEHITPSDPPVDNTLSIANAAADAAATGTAVWSGRTRDNTTPKCMIFINYSTSTFTLQSMPMNSWTYAQFSQFKASLTDWEDLGLVDGSYCYVFKKSVSIVGNAYVMEIECPNPRISAGIWFTPQNTYRFFNYAPRSYVNDKVYASRSESAVSPLPWAYYNVTENASISVADMPANSWTYAYYSQIKANYDNWPVVIGDSEVLYIAKHRISSTNANVYFMEFMGAYPTKYHLFLWHFASGSTVWYNGAFKEDIWQGRASENTPYPFVYFPAENYVTFDVHNMPMNSWTYCMFSAIKASFADWQNCGLVDGSYVLVEKQSINKAGNVYLLHFTSVYPKESSFSVWVTVGGGGDHWLMHDDSSAPKIRLACLGDSLTSGTVGVPGGPNITNNPYGYPYWLQKLNLGKLEVTNLGVGSSGWISEQYGQTPAYEYVEEIDWDDYDAVILEYGNNDWDTTIGTVDDTEPTTILGAMYTTIDYIMEQNPNIIVVITSLHFQKGTQGEFPNWASYISTMNTAFSSFCDKYHIHYLDLTRWCNSWNVADLVGDHTHPTLKGYEILGRFISGKLMSILG